MYSKNLFSYHFFIFILWASSFLFAKLNDSSVVSINGQLSVKGNYIVNQFNEPIVLRGMSLFWSQWGEGSKYYNAGVINWLKEDWKCTVVRASMGIEMGGYLENKDIELSKILRVIDACIDEGIYVIIDWHDHHAENHQQEAIEFFKEIAETYGHEPNIIYEIYNEPLQISWSDIVKPYAEAVINEIRAIDSNNIIIVGTPTWSQDVDIAANDLLEFENIAYSLHFYAATHKQFLRNKAQTALSKGAALFVSEFGTCESSGSGVLNYGETSTWIDFLEENKISWCNWSIADKDETASALKPGADSFGGWNDDQLTESGKLIRSKIVLMNTPSNIEFEKIGVHVEESAIYNYPNPFNSSTTVTFSLQKQNFVQVKLFNSNGEQINTIVNKELSRGNYSIKLDFSKYPSGNYFVNYRSKDFSRVLKLQYLK